MRKQLLTGFTIASILTFNSCTNKKNEEPRNDVQMPNATETVATAKAPTGEAGQWAKYAEKNGLTTDDVKMAIEIGNKLKENKSPEVEITMADTANMYEKMNQKNPKEEAYNGYIKKYEKYCVKRFGTDDYGTLGEFKNDDEKKVYAFRKIMFDTRDGSISEE